MLLFNHLLNIYIIIINLLGFFKMIKFILSIILLTISLNAKNYFISHGDICDEASNHYCANEKDTILNLQIALMSDKNIKTDIKADGFWGEDTKNALISFQEHYKIEPADGWMGRGTKEKLDKIYASEVFSFSEQSDMCAEVEGQECPNDYESVRNLQILLNLDTNLSLKDRVGIDGMWGSKTMAAVLEFQRFYGMVQIDGWIGKAGKRKLDKLTEAYVFPKVAKQYRKAVRSTIRRIVRTKTYGGFIKARGYPKSFSVYRNNKLLKKANSKNTKVVVDVSQQRIKLFVANEVAIDSPCTTGASKKLEPNTRRVYNKSTPKGNFRITEKIADKRSTIFGKLYRNGKMVWRGDRRKYHGPKAKYIGASLKNWMRLTSSGIGIHGSRYIKRYPATNGCIRVPYNVVKKIFKYTKTGTPVKIVP